MADIHETIGWRSGTLRPYESFSSIGAKYCYLNKVPAREYQKLILELSGITESDNKKLPFASSNFNFFKFSKLFNEPLSVVNKLHLNAISSLPKLKAKIGYKLEYKKCLTYCPVCLSFGYHSLFHQVDFISECFLHDNPLVSLEYPSDSKLFHLEHLYGVWFGNSNVWKSANTHHWDLLCTNQINENANALMSSLMGTEEKVNVNSKVLGCNFKVNLLLLAEHTGNSNNVFNSTFEIKNLTGIREIFYKCSEKDADLLISLDDEIYELLIYTSLIFSALEDNSEWKIILDNLPKLLYESHLKCQSLHKLTLNYARQLGYWPCHEWTRSPLHLKNYEDYPCERVVTFNLAKHLWIFEKSLIQSARDISYQFDLSSLNKYFEDFEIINQIVDAGLAESREVCLNKRLYGKLAEELNIQSVQFYPKLLKAKVPMGFLKEIFIELLHSHVRSWVWALFYTETLRANHKEITTCEEVFFTNVKNLSPVTILERTEKGLNLTIGEFVPANLPNWTMSSTQLNAHFSEVLTKNEHLVPSRLHLVGS